MCRKQTIFTVLLLLPLLVLCQKIEHLASYRDIDKPVYFRFNYDNDYFAATDENYTQGYNLELVSPSFKKNPINSLFPKLDTSNNTKEKFGFALEHIGFTPNNYVSPDIQLKDRPFAAAIYLKSFYIATHKTTKTRLMASFNIGLIGPGAFGEEMQVGIHEWTGNKIPKGWSNQIRNDVILNYELGLEKQLIHYKKLFSIQAKSNFKLGSLFTNASIGASSQIGIVNSVYQPNKPNQVFRLYCYSEIKSTFVVYDASLQGGLFNKKSPYTIPNKDLRRFTGQINYGIVLKTKTLYFEYTKSFISREVTSVKAARWGGIKIGFTI